MLSNKGDVLTNTHWCVIEHMKVCFVKLPRKLCVTTTHLACYLARLFVLFNTSFFRV